MCIIRVNCCDLSQIERDRGLDAALFANFGVSGCVDYIEAIAVHI